jgi:hypothetical protein
MGKLSLNRRRHVLYITRNTEYHCRGRECVGVRDRRSGAWLSRHPVLRTTMLGALRGDNVLQKQPTVGARLVFSGEHTVMTSTVLFAGRPERESIFSYTSLCRAGVIQGVAY